MKKIYIAPESKVVKIDPLSAVLQQYSNTEAAGDAEILSREGGLVWELEEVTEEE